MVSIERTYALYSLVVCLNLVPFLICKLFHIGLHAYLWPQTVGF